MKKNRRALKNTIMIILAAALVAALMFTTGIIRPGGGDMPQMPAGQQGQEQMEGGQQAEDEQQAEDGQQAEAPPEMENGEKPDMPEGQEAGDPPEKPDGDMPEMEDGEKPDMPEGQEAGDMPQNGEMPQGGDMPQGGQPGGMSVIKIILTAAEGIAFAALVLYLIMSGFNRKTLKETLAGRKKVFIFIVIAVIAGGAIGAAGIFLPMKLMGNPGAMGNPGTEQLGAGQEAGQENNGQSVDAKGATEIDGESKTLNDEYTSETADENAVLVTNGGTLKSDGATVNKKSGDGSNTDSCDFNGINAGLLVNGGSAATVKNGTIKTGADKSNGVFCTGEGSSVKITSSEISTTGDSSCRGLDATNGGKITADNVTVNTKGGSCAALATDRGGGTVSATDSDLTTEGAGSPVIYSTGKISINKCSGKAEGSQIAVIEGKNSATIKNSDVTASGAGNRGDVDVCGIMLYQSMSGDAEEGTSCFTAEGSTLSIDSDSNYRDSAPMFFVTNTEAKINLKKTELDFGSDKLLNIKGTDEWGKEGSNGGKVSLTATQQTLKGDIELDSISTLSMKLKEESSYKGTINGKNKAKSVKLELSRDSKITLTGDSYVSSIDDEDGTYSNIDFNGHKLYVDGKAIKKQS